MGRSILITGGGRGIGAATARLAASQGYAVCVNFLHNEASARTVLAGIEAAGGKGCVVQGDVADEADVRTIFDTAERELGPVSALVNNAGVTGDHGRFMDVQADTLRRVININVLGAMLCAREAIRRMSTARGGSGGAIVNVSSGASTLGSPGEYVWYAATKGAVDSMTIGLAQEVAKEGIRVNAVSPGLIDTDIHATGGQPERLKQLAPAVPLGRPGTAGEPAQAIMWLLSDAASYITGAILRVTGGR